MGESLLISLREGFEAALVITIVLAFVRRSSAPDLARWVWAGTGAALAVSALAGVVLHLTIDDLQGDSRARTFAAICLAAGGLLTWMIFWMRTHGRQLRSHLETQAASALTERSGYALAGVAFAAVLREGLETALFLLSATATSEAADVLIGTLVGLAIAVALGVLLYQGSQHINMRRFFQVTGGLIIVFAAGLMAKAVMFLQAAGDMGTINASVYDVTGISWLTGKTQVGRFLAGIFGWDPRPSFEQVAAFIAYLVPIAWFFFRPAARSQTAKAVAASVAPREEALARTHQ